LTEDDLKEQASYIERLVTENVQLKATNTQLDKELQKIKIESSNHTEIEKLTAEISRLKRLAEIDSNDFDEVVNNLNYQLDRAKAEIQFLAQNLIDASDLVKAECKSMKLRAKFNLHFAQAVGRALIDKRDF
jgi:predicted RNase H-like nuclease (RuvC/YqgF family)